MSGNVSNVWKRMTCASVCVCVCVGGCVCTRMCFIFHLREHRLNVKLPADRKLFVRFPFLVYVSRAKILHQCVPGDKRPHWNTKETKRTHTCMNNIRVVRRGKKKKKKAVIHLHNHLGQACKEWWGTCSWTTNTTRAKWVIITVMMIITDYPSREKIKFEQIIWWLILPTPAHRENWVGSGWAANNDKLSIPAIILTIIIALVYFIQWWKWTPWAEYRVVTLKVQAWERSLCHSSM